MLIINKDQLNKSIESDKSEVDRICHKVLDIQLQCGNEEENEIQRGIKKIVKRGGIVLDPIFQQILEIQRQFVNLRQDKITEYFYDEKLQIEKCDPYRLYNFWRLYRICRFKLQLKILVFSILSFTALSIWLFPFCSTWYSKTHLPMLFLACIVLLFTIISLTYLLVRNSLFVILAKNLLKVNPVHNSKFAKTLL